MKKTKTETKKVTEEVKKRPSRVRDTGSYKATC